MKITCIKTCSFGRMTLKDGWAYTVPTAVGKILIRRGVARPARDNDEDRLPTWK